MATTTNPIKQLNSAYYLYYFGDAESFDDFTDDDFLRKLPTAEMFERLSILCHNIASQPDAILQDNEVPLVLFQAATHLKRGDIEAAEATFELIAARVDALFREIFLAFIEKEKGNAPPYLGSIIQGNCMEVVKKYIDKKYPYQWVLRAHLTQVAPRDKIRDMTLDFVRRVQDAACKS